MKKKLIALSKDMGEYNQRDILTSYAIKEIMVGRTVWYNPEGITICYYGPSKEEFEDRLLRNSPKTVVGGIARRISGIEASPGVKIEEELQTILARTQLIRETGKSPPTIESIAEDLIISVNNAHLIPNDCKLRYLVPFTENLSNKLYLFLDRGQIEINEEHDAVFYLDEKSISNEFNLSPSKNIVPNNSKFSNSEILFAYGLNLQNALKKR